MRYVIVVFLSVVATLLITARLQTGSFNLADYFGLSQKKDKEKEESENGKSPYGIPDQPEFDEEEYQQKKEPETELGYESDFDK